MSLRLTILLEKSSEIRKRHSSQAMLQMLLLSRSSCLSLAWRGTSNLLAHAGIALCPLAAMHRLTKSIPMGDRLGRMSFYSKLEGWFNLYVYQIGLSGSYIHEFENVIISELLNRNYLSCNGLCAKW